MYCTFMKMMSAIFFMFFLISISFAMDSYRDIKPGHWAQKDIVLLEEKGFLNVFSGTKFEAHKRVSVRQFVRTVKSLSGKEIAFGFKKRYVTKKEAVYYLRKILKFNKKVSVNDQYINRAQFVSLLSACGLLNSNVISQDFLYDVGKQQWYYRDVLNFVNRGGLSLLRGRKLYPRKKVRHIEFYRFIAYIEGYYRDVAFSSDDELYVYVSKLFGSNPEYYKYIKKNEMLDILSDIGKNISFIKRDNSYVNRVQLVAIIAKLYQDKKMPKTVGEKPDKLIKSLAEKDFLEQNINFDAVLSVANDLSKTLSESSEQIFSEITEITEDAEKIKGAGSFLLSKELMADHEKKRNEKHDEYTWGYGLKSYINSELSGGEIKERSVMSYSASLSTSLVILPFDLSFSYGYDNDNKNRDDSLINTLLGGSGSLDLNEGTLLILYTRSLTSNHKSLFLIGNFFNILLLNKDPLFWADMTQLFLNGSTIMGVQNDKVDEKPGKSFGIGISQKYFANYTFSYEYAQEIDVDDNIIVNNLYGFYADYELSEKLFCSLGADYSFYIPDEIEEKSSDISYSIEFVYSLSDKHEVYFDITNDKTGIGHGAVPIKTEYAIGFSGEL